MPPVWAPRYHSQAEIDAFVEALASSPGALQVERLELGTSAGAHAVHGIAFGNPEGAELASRPTVFLVGGLDGRSYSGCEAVLKACSELFAHAAELPAGIAICALPCASPDALELARSGKGDGRDLTPVDDDGDGRVDEDGPDDLDKDGAILEMLIEDPDGEWTRSSDPRLLVRARPFDPVRYKRLVEGRDDDGDGRYNEDPPGGIQLDRSFPVGWEKRDTATWSRPLPLSAPLARALADLWLARRTVLVLLFQGEHGEIAFASAEGTARPPLEANACDTLASLLARTSNRAYVQARTLAQAHGAAQPGAALEWVHEVLGAMGAEVALWGPLVESGPGARSVNLTDARLDEPHAQSDSSPPPPDEVGLAWMHWLDNTRGGIGFTDWHPVELEGGRTALVGGFDPLLRLNPPEKSLGAAVGPSGAFVLECLRALPALDVRVVERKRDGEVCTIRVRVENKGRLPSALSTSANWAKSPGLAVRPASLELALVLPPGARLLVGEEQILLPDLPGGASSRELRWVATAPPNSVFQVAIQSPFTAPIRREVKP
ncbi:MAG: hypothetical protein IPJ19_13995 [Planctomycetes bacterium]|nr:hypothetical protein [Planctomycetota bacterium]